MELVDQLHVTTERETKFKKQRHLHKSLYQYDSKYPYSQCKKDIPGQRTCNLDIDKEANRESREGRGMQAGVSRESTCGFSVVLKLI